MISMDRPKSWLARAPWSLPVFELICMVRARSLARRRCSRDLSKQIDHQTELPRENGALSPAAMCKQHSRRRQGGRGV